MRTDQDNTQDHLGGFAGELVEPADSAYDSARRVFSAEVDRRPALIARCASVSDVTAALTEAAERGWPVSVRCTGHSLAGYSVNDGGIVIDLSAMKRVEVDPLRRRVRVGAGVTWGELDRETEKIGLAVTGARTSTVGVVGVTLGGGSGWLERKLGLSCERLLGAELVSAGGEVLRVSPREHRELLWALRGGGGNFGVVTWIDLALHPLASPVLGGQLLYPRAMACELLGLLRELMANAPEALGIGVAMTSTPDAPFVPEPVRGRPIVGLTVCYAGDSETGQDLLRPLRQEFSPVVDTIVARPYTEVQRILDPLVPPGRRYAAKAEHLERLSDDAIEVLVDHAGTAPSPSCEVVVLPAGGALDRAPAGSSPLAERRAAATVQVLAAWDQPEQAERHTAWALAGSIALEPFSSGACLNLTGQEPAERIRGAFDRDSYARLQAVKRDYDPHNVFRSNHNIPPRDGTRSG